MNPTIDEPGIRGLNTPAKAASQKRWLRALVPMHVKSPSKRRRKYANPLLNMPIGMRLALGFLIPALIAALTLSTVGMQSRQQLVQESTFYQNLLNAETSLTTAVGEMQQMHTNLLQVANYAARPHPLTPILQDNQAEILRIEQSFQAILSAYLGQDLITSYPDLATLFNQAGQGARIEEQRTYSEGVQATWHAYQDIQEQALRQILAGNIASAQILLVTQGDGAFSDAQRDLQALIVFNGSLAPAFRDAANVEAQKLLVSTLLAVLGVLLGIGLVGWLISSTLVKRLSRLRSVVQAIANGQVHARLDTDGRDEIADVSQATNAMVDTLVGLLDETKSQRDELAKGEELKSLHAALQREQKALKEANARLAALASIDQLTDLPNHRALLEQLDKEIDRARRYGRPLAIVFFDGDHFKRVNDRHGHAVGDAVLRELGQRVSSVLRGGDTLGRYGGEEFMVVLPETNLEKAKIVAERMRAAVAAFPLASSLVDGGVTVTMSIGLAAYPTDALLANELREKADQAMYWAKRLGRNQVRTVAEAEQASGDTVLRETIHSLERKEDQFLDGLAVKKSLQSEQLGVVYSLMWLLELRDHGIFTHSYDVSDLATGIARIMGQDEQTVHTIATAALLHDIGKIAIPDALLQKESPLSAQEWVVMRQHPEIGAQILEFSIVLRELMPAIRHHHERWDGTGYPEQLKGEDIPFAARIISVAEAYQSMLSDRPYQAARSPEAALAELQRKVGSQFDPQVVAAFATVLHEREHMEEPIALSSV